MFPATWKESRGGCSVQKKGSPQFSNSQVVRWRVCFCNKCFLLPGRRHVVGVRCKKKVHRNLVTVRLLGGGCVFATNVSCYLEGVTWWMYGAKKRSAAMKKSQTCSAKQRRGRASTIDGCAGGDLLPLINQESGWSQNHIYIPYIKYITAPLYYFLEGAVTDYWRNGGKIHIYF